MIEFLDGPVSGPITGTEIGWIGILVAVILFGFAVRWRIKDEERSKRIEEKLEKMGAYLGGIPELPKTNPIRKGFNDAILVMDKAGRGEAKYDEAIQIFRKLLPDAEGSQKVALLNLIGLCFHHQSEFDQALGSYKESLELAKEIKDKEGEAVALGNIGAIYQVKEELDKALEYQEKALEINKELGRKEGIAQSLGNIGLIYSDKGELDKALENYNKSLGLFTEMGMTREIELVKSNIAKTKE